MREVCNRSDHPVSSSMWPSFPPAGLRAIRAAKSLPASAQASPITLVKANCFLHSPKLNLQNKRAPGNPPDHFIFRETGRPRGRGSSVSGVTWFP
ncbi:hypothetical protein AAFF_G00072620 [Aldrovandia affinis]|uniref:Uncharacterized protein n=1 Tax=Aldrovandia affinis TaxID=143900 RepID=A0AAD7RYX4_9TELE|nr:hypothetical protein AAFF_G00072620 [Aldrovandia affinis]